MTRGRGVSAALPAGHHQRPTVMDEAGVVVVHVNEKGDQRALYDFGRLPGTAEMRRSLAALFARQAAPTGLWRSIETSREMWTLLGTFTRWLAQMDSPPQDIDQISPAIWSQWRVSRPATPMGERQVGKIGSLLRLDQRLPVATHELTLKRVIKSAAKETAYSAEQFDLIKQAATRSFRLAWQRITDNRRHLAAWRSGEYTEGTWPLGPVCQVCYTAILRAPAECARCHVCQPLIARDDDGASICGPCAGFDVDYTCHRCGRAGNPYGREGCAHCVLTDRVHDLLAGTDGKVPAALQPLAEALVRTESPFKQIQWIKDSPNARLLARIVADGRPISHDLLDELPPSRNVHYIRHMMTQTGVLPERHEDLERLPAWLDHHLVGTPAEHANLIRPFLRWFLLRRARGRAQVRRFPASAGRDLRRRILVALEFLAWLDKEDLTLRTLRQDDLDRWLDQMSPHRGNLVRYFLKWAAERQITGKLAVPSIPRQEPADLLDDDERWRLLRRCLTDDTLPVDVRAAGARTLLFGLSAERVRHLTTDQLTYEDGQDFLTAGRRPSSCRPSWRNSCGIWALTPNAAWLFRATSQAAAADCSPASSPASRSPTTPSPPGSLATASTSEPPATARSPPSRPACPPRSWPTCSACTSTPPSDGSSTPDGTGPSTSPHGPPSRGRHETDSFRSAAVPDVAESGAGQRVTGCYLAWPRVSFNPQRIVPGRSRTSDCPLEQPEVSRADEPVSRSVYQCLPTSGHIRPLLIQEVNAMADAQAQDVELSRVRFRSLLAANPNYFGTLPNLGFDLVEKKAQDTSYERLTCVSYSPERDRVEATIEIRRSFGYSGGLCSAGSFEHVRFFVSYDGGATWDDAGLAAVNVHDLAVSRDCIGADTHPLSYVVGVNYRPRRSWCAVPALPKIRAILSWNVEPTPGDPGYTPVWGDVRTCNGRIRPRRFILPDIAVKLPKDILAQIPPYALQEIPHPDPDPDPYAEVGLETLAKVYREQRIPDHRFALPHLLSASDAAGLGAGSQAAQALLAKKLDIDLTKLIDLVSTPKGDTTYEELHCVGLDNNLDQLVATFQIKRPSGYSGGPCSTGSVEYVAFWADFGDECQYTYFGRVEVRVHDYTELPSGGLCLAAILPVDLGSIRRDCHSPVFGRVRAVLSWATPPSTVDPDEVPHWGNRVDAHVQVRPGRRYDGTARIEVLGGVDTDDLSVATGMTTTAVASIAASGQYLGPNCPFAGTVTLHGATDPALAGQQYRVHVRNLTTGGPTSVLTEDFYVVPQIGPGYWETPGPGGWSPWPTWSSNMWGKLAHFNPGGNDKWEIQLELSGSGVVDTRTVQMDNLVRGTVDPADPVNAGRLDLNTGGACRVPRGPLSGEFVARDLHFYSWSLSVFGGPGGPVPATPFLPNPPGTPPIPQSMQTGLGGQPFTIDLSALSPCGYVVRLTITDRAVVDSVIGFAHYTTIDRGICLE